MFLRVYAIISEAIIRATRLFTSTRALPFWQIGYIFCLVLPLLLVMTPTISGRLAVATEMMSPRATFDPGFDCGNKYWGIKNYQNEVSVNPSIPPFGRLSTDCTDNTDTPAIPENGAETTRSYATLHAETANSNQSVAWQAAFQGTDPWGVKSTRDGQALANNNLFPLSSQLNYTLDVSYLWLGGDNSRPHGTNDNVHANILVDLWFAENSNNYSSSSNVPGQEANNKLVIDLAFANLENVNGTWNQLPYLWEGAQYYKPYAERGDNGEIVYHYNIVLDIDGKNPGVWYHVLPSQYPKGLNQIISDAFSYGYEFEDDTSAPTLQKENFNLVDIEAGAEVFNDAGASGELTASFSLCNLSYMQTDG
jgi:hypothetical protein